MTTIVADVLYRPETPEMRFLPEGPVAIETGKFSWVAIQHGAGATHGSLNVFDLSTRTNGCFPLEGRPGFALPTHHPDRFIVGLERRIELVDIIGGKPEILCKGIDDDVENTIVNDAVACSAGVIFGTKHLEFSQQIAGLYFFRTRDRRLFHLRSGLICSNGKVILSESDDRVTFLDIDTPTKKVVRYSLDVDNGTIFKPETVLDLQDVAAFPDGMIATPDGRSVIISFYNPEPAEFGETRQYSLESGECEVVWQTPGSPQNTCPLLIEWHGKIRLVITTAVEHMPPERQQAAPEAGSLFIADTPFQVAPKPQHVKV